MISAPDGCLVPTVLARSLGGMPWDSRPCLWTIHAGDPLPVLCRVPLPDEAWTGRIEEDLDRIAAGARAGCLLPGLRPRNPYGTAFCFGRQVTVPGSEAGRRGLAHLLGHALPYSGRLQVRGVRAVTRGGPWTVIQSLSHPQHPPRAFPCDLPVFGPRVSAALARVQEAFVFPQAAPGGRGPREIA